jgi:DNA-binding transcriptional LysR family regulator
MLLCQEMDLEDLAAVRAIVEAGTFSAGAASLRVTQPALSRRVARLERELGGRLFDRLPRHAAPTPLAETLAGSAAAILNEIETARADAMAVARGAAGRIRMSSLAGGIPALARGLSLFQQRHSDVVVELRALDAEAAVHALRERRVDLATLPGSALEPGLRSRKLARWRVILAVRPDHPFARKNAVAISALEDEPLLMLAHEFMVSRHVMDLAERTGVRLQPRLRDASPEAVLSLARRGWGIGVLPDSVRIPAELVSVPLARAGASAEFDYVIAWLADRTLPTAGATLVQTLVRETAAFRKQ